MTTRTTFAAILAKKLAPLTEAAEEIQEVSDDTLRRYSSKARAQITAITKKPGPTSKVGKVVAAKREAGITKASDILSERRGKEHDAHSKASHAAFKAAADDTLSKHGYEVTHAGVNSNIYTKHDPETNTLFVAKHHFGSPSTRDSHHTHEGAIKMVSSNGTTSDIRHSSWSLRPSRLLQGEEPVDLHAEHSKAIGDELDRHHRWSKDRVFGSHMNEDVAYPSDEMLAEEYAHITEESLEEIDLEESRKSKSAYVSPARKKWIKDHEHEMEGGKIAETKDEETEVIEEGRGRPRKDGTSKEGADREHIIMQLRKHVSLRGQNPIEFKDGSKASPGEGQARLALIIHNGLRTPQEKANYMDRLDANHESFKDAVRSKSPEEAGKAPTQKSRITLPAIDRLNAKLGPDTN